MNDRIEIASTDATGGTVHVLHISHRAGDNITLHATAKLAEQAKVDFAHTYWHEVAGRDGRPDTPPKEHAELVRLYFTDHPDGDCATIHETGVEGERGGAGTHPYTVADGFKGLGGQLKGRSLMIEGITTEAMWRDLERALGLPRYRLGRFKEWAAGDPKLLTAKYDLDAAARWAQSNGLPYEDERLLRYDPAAKSDEAAEPGRPVVTIRRANEDASQDTSVEFRLDEFDTVSLEFNGVPYVLVTPQGVGWWPDPEENWQRLHTGGLPISRTVWLEGLNTPAAWQDLEKHLGLGEGRLGAFVDWTGSRRFEEDRVDVDGVMDWAWRNGLDHEDHRVIRYEPNAWAAQQLHGLAQELGVGESDLDELVHELHSETASQAYNDGQGPADEEQAHEDLHRAAEVAASEVNNNGLAAQVRCLVDQLGATDAEARLRAVAAEVSKPVS